MEISLSRNSWHAKYYNFVKGYYPTYEFKSLCPYFWTILTLILLSPVIVLWKVINRLVIKPIGGTINHTIHKALSQPSKPRKEPSKFSKWYDRNDKKIGIWFARIYFGLMIFLLIFGLTVGIINLLHAKGTWLGIIYIFAGIGGLTTSVFLIWMIISFFETDIWKMIKGMMYSTKNKVCPMITWKTDENN